MVNEKIRQVLEALQAAQIRSIRGYPGGKISAVREPVAAVSLEEYAERFLTLAVDVYSPMELDGSTCEETALNVADILKEKMAVCTVGKCVFSKTMGLFTVRVLAKWHRELDYTVDINEDTIACVTDLQVEKNIVKIPYVDAMTGELQIKAERDEWKITVTDIWPLNRKLPAEQADGFTLFVMRPGGLEAYEECLWEKITREETPAGVLRTRVAKTYRDPVIGEG